MPSFLQALVATQGAITAISGAFNTLYFASYSTPRLARRIAALVLALVNLSIFLQGVYWGLLPLFLRSYEYPRLLKPGPLLTMGLLPLVASLAMTVFIVRQWSHRRGKP